jgi:hypothetical protein
MYQTEDGLTKIETTFDNDKVWLSIDQMAELFTDWIETLDGFLKLSLFLLSSHYQDNTKYKL